MKNNPIIKIDCFEINTQNGDIMKVETLNVDSETNNNNNSQVFDGSILNYHPWENNNDLKHLIDIA